MNQTNAAGPNQLIQRSNSMISQLIALRGHQYLSHGDTKNATADASKALECNPRNPSTTLLRSLVHQPSENEGTPDPLIAPSTDPSRHLRHAKVESGYRLEIEGKGSFTFPHTPKGLRDATNHAKLLNKGTNLISDDDDMEERVITVREFHELTFQLLQTNYDNLDYDEEANATVSQGTQPPFVYSGYWPFWDDVLNTPAGTSKAFDDTDAALLTQKIEHSVRECITSELIGDLAKLLESRDAAKRARDRTRKAHIYRPEQESTRSLLEAVRYIHTHEGPDKFTALRLSHHLHLTSEESYHELTCFAQLFKEALRRIIDTIASNKPLTEQIPVASKVDFNRDLRNFACDELNKALARRLLSPRSDLQDLKVG